MKKLTIIGTGLLSAALYGTLAMGASTGNGIKVEHLGSNNTLVRVTGSGRYILNDDASVSILVDGKPDRTINVRLAKTKVDYTVPFDLSPYKGRNVVLNITTSQNRATVREAKEDACWNNMSVTDSFPAANREKFRPAFHHTPVYGWMNDPNGMFYKDGVWHLYYQWNPYGSKWQNMTWGHSSSTDLINWQHHPAAIEPDGLGTVFSGSCAIDKDDTAGFGSDAVIALYTSAAASQVQSLAHSNDNGNTFEIYPGNPVITLESEARDPNMFWNEATGEWNLVLAHALEHEMLVFTSPDMKQWTLQSAFGKGLGAQDGVWECPDLFELAVDGSDQKKWVLICNINPGGPFGGSATQYFIGEFDGKTFTPDRDADGNVPTKWMDYGKDHYATVSWSNAPDNRRTVIGWMSNWQYAAEVPTMQYRSANTLPREIGLFRASDGEIYTSCTPSPEIGALRGNASVKKRSFTAGKKSRTFALPEANGGICEITLEITPKKGVPVNLTLANEAGNKVEMVYNPAESTFSFDRYQSGQTDFSQDFPAITTAPAFTDGGNLRLRIFIDRSSIEVFEQNGRFAMTNLVFPESPYTTLSVNAPAGNARIENLAIYPLRTTN